MVEDTHMEDASKVRHKRKLGKMKGANPRQNQSNQVPRRNFKVDKRMQKLFKKRARDYNSDDEADENGVGKIGKKLQAVGDGKDDKGIDTDNYMGRELQRFGDREDGDTLPGITKLDEGCTAFKLAFKGILKKTVSDDSLVLGPVLSAHKKMVAEKLAEEENEKNVKGEVKKERQMVREKGHVKPANFLDSQEKFLIGVATKGVVKLFNAVNKAQSAQKGLNPSRSKDAKVIKKRRKEAFFSELGKKSLPKGDTRAKVDTSSGQGQDERPSWAPLRDNYMLTNPKLKDWDKMKDACVPDSIGYMAEDSGSDDE